MALNLVCKTSLYFKLGLSNNAPLLNYYSPSIQARRVSAHWSTLQGTVKARHKTSLLTHLLPKLQSPAPALLHVRLSAPLCWLPQSVPVQFLHPGTQPEVLLPLERWQYTFWEAARCWLILGRRWFFLHSGWTNRVLSKQASEFGFCLAHKTERGFVLWNLTWR